MTKLSKLICTFAFLTATAHGMGQKPIQSVTCVKGAQRDMNSGVSTCFEPRFAFNGKSYPLSVRYFYKPATNEGFADYAAVCKALHPNFKNGFGATAELKPGSQVWTAAFKANGAFDRLVLTASPLSSLSCR